MCNDVCTYVCGCAAASVWVADSMTDSPGRALLAVAVFPAPTMVRGVDLRDGRVKRYSVINRSIIYRYRPERKDIRILFYILLVLKIMWLNIYFERF